MSEDSTVNALASATAGLLVTELPLPTTLSVICRVFWPPDDVGSHHTLTAELFP